MVRLRGHHLICLHFFKGEGYSKEFVENLSKVLKTIERKGVDLVEGGDDVCAACPSYQNGRCMHEPGMNEKVKRLDILATRLLDIEDRRLDWSHIKSRIPFIIEEWKKNACANCEWIGVCKKNENWKTPF